MVPQRDSDRVDRVIAAHERRRAVRSGSVVEMLRERDGPVSMFDLAAEVVSEVPETPEAPSRDDRLDWITYRLHHVELPRLADAGLLEYDAERKVVSLPDDRSGSFRLP